jgi:glycosyltransferase involved in cell wall biosynthesis
MSPAVDSLSPLRGNTPPREMRVLHVIPSIAAFRGGPSQVIRLVAEGLAECGIGVDVVTTDDNGSSRLAVPLGVPVREGKVTYWYFSRQLRAYNCSLPLSRWLWRHAAEYDLIHIHTVFAYASTAAAITAQAKAVPYVVRPLGVLNRWGFANRKPLLKRISFAVVEKRILRHAAAIQYTSEQERIEAERLCPGSHPVVLPNPIRIPAEWAPAAIPDAGAPPQPVVLFMSRLDEKKGLDLLIQAFALVRRRFPESRLVVAGSGEPSVEKSLRLLAAKELAADAIEWAGFVSGAAKRELLARAAVFVLPSYSENFGVAVVEAMVAGLPVVISDQIGIHPLVAEGGAGIVTPCSVPALGEALIQLLDDPPKARAMGQCGRTVALNEFAVPVVSAKLVSLYQAILAR